MSIVVPTQYIDNMVKDMLDRVDIDIECARLAGINAANRADEYISAIDVEFKIVFDNEQENK